MKKNPPRLASFLFKAMERDDGFYTILGDIEEIYEEILKEKGGFYADLWYWSQLFLAVFPFALRSFFWRLEMFKSNMKLSYRSLSRNKGYTFINVFGLSVGLACSIIIILYVNSELSYDHYHKNAERIYRVAEHRIVPIGEFYFATSCPPLAPALKDEYPQIEETARFRRMPAGVIKADQQKHLTQNVWAADQNSLSLFSIDILQGDPKSLLERPGTVVLTQKMASTLFGDKSPLGKMVEFTISQSNTRSDNTYTFEVTGVVANPPDNTHLKYGSLVSYNSLDDIYYHYLNEWHTGGTYTYIKLAPEVNPELFEANLKNIADKYVGDDFKRWGQTREYFLQPLTKIHLDSNLQDEAEAPGNIIYIYIYGMIAFLILLIGCMNFINLSSVRSVTRTREVGLRKVVGALKNQLAGQFLLESMLVTVFSFSVAVILAYYLLPLFNTLAGSNLTLDSIHEPMVYYSFIGLVFIVAFFAGSYPAFILTTFKPIMAIQGATNPGSRGSNMLKILVTAQFVISILLIICTFTVFKQLKYIQNSNPGFNGEHKIVVPFISNSQYFKKHYETIKQEFLQHDSIVSATISSTVPGHKPMTSGIRLRGEGHPWPEPGWQDPIRVNFLSIDENFLTNFEIDMVVGTPFTDEDTDGSSSMLINEAALPRLGFSTPEEALGVEVRESYYGRTKTITGVTRDFYYEGLQKSIDPIIMEYSSSRFSNMTLTFNGNDIESTLVFIERKWEELFPEHVLYSYFLDEDFDRLYRYEAQVGKTLGVVTLLGVLIACMGLFGLASFVARKKRKEIGIRKVMGASSFNILSLLSKQYVYLVLLASVIAVPVAHILMSRWLEDFAVRTTLNAPLYGLAILSALFLSIVTVLFQSIKAATSNPVDELKEE